MQRSRSTVKIISLLVLAIVFMALLAVQAGSQQIASGRHGYIVCEGYTEVDATN